LITKKQKPLEKEKRKNYQSNEERKIKDRISTLNKSFFFERKTNSDENKRRKRNRVNNINTLIPKNYEEAMNSESARTNGKMQLTKNYKIYMEIM